MARGKREGREEGGARGRGGGERGGGLRALDQNLSLPVTAEIGFGLRL